MSIVPDRRPEAPREVIEEILRIAGVTDAVAIVGWRGYYFRSMGDPAKNDRGIYDDAIFVVGPTAYASFFANTDPSRHREGIATLKPGTWLYKVGIHGLSKPAAQRYKALVQAAEVTVARDNHGSDTGWFGINIHRGGNATTSSLGCQTVHPDHWPAFFALVQQQMRAAGQTTVRYHLVEDPRMHG